MERGRDSHERDDHVRMSDIAPYAYDGAASQYSFEGQMAQLGNFASAARRATGWRGTFARLLAVWALALIIGSFVVLLLHLLGFWT